MGSWHSFTNKFHHLLCLNFKDQRAAGEYTGYSRVQRAAGRAHEDLGAADAKVLCPTPRGRAALSARMRGGEK